MAEQNVNEQTTIEPASVKAPKTPKAKNAPKAEASAEHLVMLVVDGVEYPVRSVTVRSSNGDVSTFAQLRLSVAPADAMVIGEALVEHNWRRLRTTGDQFASEVSFTEPMFGSGATQNVVQRLVALGNK